jgi:hypothetical protein
LAFSLVDPSIQIVGPKELSTWEALLAATYDEAGRGVHVL